MGNPDDADVAVEAPSTHRHAEVLPPRIDDRVSVAGRSQPGPHRVARSIVYSRVAPGDVLGSVDLPPSPVGGLPERPDGLVAAGRVRVVVAREDPARLEVR